MVDGPDTRTATQNAKENDALHILPLRLIRLRTRALKRARIVKNARLEGMIELFADDRAGSGQVRANELPKFIDMRGPERTDLVIVKRLCDLPSYDVYSLRTSLKELGIKAENPDDLRVSEEHAKRLSRYIRRYTRPMLESIYGEAQAALLEVETVADLFANSQAQQARENLVWLSERLQIELRNVPLFISEYGDISSALAFYEYSLRRISPSLDSFLLALAELRESRLGSDDELVKTCQSLETRLAKMRTDMSAMFSRFENDTRHMWKDISATAFNDMKRRVRACYKSLGGGLCAMTVKMNAWKDSFPSPKSGSLSARAEFVRREMRPGLDALPRLGTLL